jgi:hypothetical protein
MRRRFIIVLNSVNAQQQRALQSYLSSSGMIWWHWIAGLWLVVHPNGGGDVTVIRDTLNVLIPGVHKMVFEVSEGGNWAGLGPAAQSRNMFDWLRQYWS